MAEVHGVKQSLVQTQAIERVQEAARRQGEEQQKSFATTLNRQADLRGHRVNEGEKTQQEALDPNARRGEEKEDERRPAARKPAEGADPPEDEDQERGRHVDARA